jgi:hypothetical protein
MSASLLELRDQIIIDCGIEGNPKFPNPRLNRMINLAQRNVQTELNGLGMKKWENTDALTLGSSTFGGVSVLKSAALGTDCPNILESPSSIIFIECSGGGVYGVAQEVDKDRFLEQIQNTFMVSTLKQPVFMRLANFIWLAPSTISAATAYYYKGISDLTADGNTTEIPTEFEEFIIKKVKLEIDAILGKIQEKESASAEIQNQLTDTFNKFALAQQPEQNRATQQDVKSKLQ